MAKKDKVRLTYSTDLDAVDSELAAAMDVLDKTNDRVDALLREYRPPPPEMSPAEGDSPVASETPPAGEEPAPSA